MIDNAALWTLNRLEITQRQGGASAMALIPKAHLRTLADAGLICWKTDGVFVLRAGRKAIREHRTLLATQAAERCQKVNA